MKRFVSVLLATSLMVVAVDGFAQSNDDERRKFEEDKRKLEEDRRKLEDEKRLIEERRRLDEDRKRLEEDRRKLEEEKKKRDAPTPTPTPTPTQMPPKSEPLPAPDKGGDKGALPPTREKPPHVDDGDKAKAPDKTPGKSAPPEKPPGKKGADPPPAPMPPAEPANLSHKGQILLALEPLNLFGLFASRVNNDRANIGYLFSLLVGFGGRWQTVLRIGIAYDNFVDATEFTLGYGNRYYFIEGVWKPYFMWNGGIVIGGGSNFVLHPRAGFGLEYDRSRNFGLYFETGPGIFLAFKDNAQRISWSFAIGANYRF